MMRTFSENVKGATSVAPKSIATATNGAWVDTLGYENAVMVVGLGAFAQGSDTLTVEVYEHTAGSDITQGTLHTGATTGALATADTGKMIMVNLNLSECKRYVRAKCSVVGNGGYADVKFFLFNGREMPPTQEKTAVTVQS